MAVFGIWTLDHFDSSPIWLYLNTNTINLFAVYRDQNNGLKFKTHKNDVIAVHCTHGFNRTGYLIAAYLYQEVGLGIEEAVEAFAVCRPDGIYKQV